LEVEVGRSVYRPCTVR